MIVKHLIIILTLTIGYYQYVKMHNEEPGSIQERSLYNKTVFVNLLFYKVKLHFHEEKVESTFNNMNIFIIPKLKKYVTEFIDYIIRDGTNYTTYYFYFIFIKDFLIILLTYFTVSNYFFPSLILMVNYGLNIYKIVESYKWRIDKNIMKNFEFDVNVALTFFIMINYLYHCCREMRKRRKVNSAVKVEKIKIIEREPSNKFVDLTGETCEGSDSEDNQPKEKKEIFSWIKKN